MAAAKSLDTLEATGRSDLEVMELVEDMAVNSEVEFTEEVLALVVEFMEEVLALVVEFTEEVLAFMEATKAVLESPAVSMELIPYTEVLFMEVMVPVDTENPDVSNRKPELLGIIKMNESESENSILTNT